VSHVVDCHGWVDRDVIAVGPETIITQDFIVRRMVTWHNPRIIYALVKSVYFLVTLNQNSAPIVALVKTFWHLSSSHNVWISKAFSQVAEECPEEVTFIFILCRHQLVKAFLPQGLNNDFSAMQFNTMFFKLVFLVEAWCFATVGSSGEAVFLLKLVFAIHALESGDSGCE